MHNRTLFAMPLLALCVGAPARTPAPAPLSAAPAAGNRTLALAEGVSLAQAVGHILARTPLDKKREALVKLIMAEPEEARDFTVLMVIKSLLQPDKSDEARQQYETAKAKYNAMPAPDKERFARQFTSELPQPQTDAMLRGLLAVFLDKMTRADGAGDRDPKPPASPAPAEVRSLYHAMDAEAVKGETITWEQVTAPDYVEEYPDGSHRNKAQGVQEYALSDRDIKEGRIKPLSERTAVGLISSDGNTVTVRAVNTSHTLVFLSMDILRSLSLDMEVVLARVDTWSRVNGGWVLTKTQNQSARLRVEGRRLSESLLSHMRRTSLKKYGVKVT